MPVKGWKPMTCEWFQLARQLPRPQPQTQRSGISAHSAHTTTPTDNQKQHIMALSVNWKCSVSSGPKEAHGCSSWGALLFAAAGATVVGLGGLGSVQNMLAGNDKINIPAALAGLKGFTGILPHTSRAAQVEDTSDVFRFYWFILCFQVVAVAAAYLAGHFNKVSAYRTSLLGLFIIATMLNIKASDAWLGASETTVLSTDIARDRTRTTVAGYIMCAALDALIIVGLGWKHCA